MKFHGIKMLGKIFSQIIADISSVVFDSSYLSTIILDQATGNLYYGDPASNSFRNITDIPTGSIFLFDSDTATVGYNLLTSVDDKVVFIGSGSGAGGNPGGGSVGNWANEAHSHTLSSHTHTTTNHLHYFGNHTHAESTGHFHGWILRQSPTITYTNNSLGNYITVQSYGTAQTGTGPAIQENNNNVWSTTGYWFTNRAYTTTAPPNDTSYTGNSTATTGVATGSSSTDAQPSSSSWRPKGRNVTRQQRI